MRGIHFFWRYLHYILFSKSCLWFWSSYFITLYIGGSSIFLVSHPLHGFKTPNLTFRWGTVKIWYSCMYYWTLASKSSLQCGMDWISLSGWLILLGIILSLLFMRPPLCGNVEGVGWYCLWYCCWRIPIFWIYTLGIYLWFVVINCLQLVKNIKDLLMSHYWLTYFLNSSMMMIIYTYWSISEISFWYVMTFFNPYVWVMKTILPLILGLYSNALGFDLMDGFISSSHVSLKYFWWAIISSKSRTNISPFMKCRTNIMSTGISFEKRMIFLVVLLSDQMLSSVGEQIPLKDIPSGTGEPLKETENMLEDENDKKLRTSTGSQFGKDTFF